VSDTKISESVLFSFFFEIVSKLVLIPFAGVLGQISGAVTSPCRDQPVTMRQVGGEEVLGAQATSFVSIAVERFRAKKERPLSLDVGALSPPQFPGDAYRLPFAAGVVTALFSGSVFNDFRAVWFRMGWVTIAALFFFSLL